MRPDVPGWLLEELRLVDRALELRWIPERSEFLLCAQSGETLVPYGFFHPRELNRELVRSVQIAIRRRDQGVTVGQVLHERQQAAFRRERRREEELRAFARARAEIEVDCANPSFKAFALGGLGSPTPGYLGTRIEGIRSV